MSGGGAGPVSVTGRVRSDRRCGAEFPLDDGEPSECDGGSEVNFTYLLIYNIYNIYNIYTLEPLLLQLGLLRAGRGPLRVRGVRGLQDRRGQGAGLGGAVAPGQEVGGYTGYNIYTRVYYLLQVRGGVPAPRQLGPDPVRPEQRELLLQQVGLLRGRRGALRLPGVRQLQRQQINLYIYIFIANIFFLSTIHICYIHSYLHGLILHVSLKVCLLSCFVF